MLSHQAFFSSQNYSINTTEIVVKNHKDMKFILDFIEVKVLLLNVVQD